MADEIRPGWKTTEWWMNLLVVLSGLFVSSGLMLESHWAVKIAGLIAAALSQSTYSYSRGKVKAAQPVKLPSWAEEERPE